MLTFVIFLCAWVAVGSVVIEVNGRIMVRKMMRALSLNDEWACHRLVMIKNMEEGKNTECTFPMYIFEALTWPVTIYLAGRGYRRFMQKIKGDEENGERTE